MITDYKNLPIGKYLRILSVTDGEPVEERRNPAILSILDGRTVEELEALPIMEFATMMRRAGFLLQAPRPAKTRKEYVCGPFKLVPVVDFKKVTTAQYVDFQTFTNQHGQGGEPPVVEVLSCLLIPSGHKYCDGYEPGEVQAAIRDFMSVEDAMSLYSFFTERLHKLMRRLAISLKRTARRLPKTAEMETIKTRLETLTKPTVLQAVGDGLQILMPFQRLSERLGMTSGE